MWVAIATNFGAMKEVCMLHMWVATVTNFGAMKEVCMLHMWVATVTKRVQPVLKTTTHCFIPIPNADVINTSINVSVIFFIKHNIQFYSISRTGWD